MVLIASLTVLLLNGTVYLIVGENQIVLQLFIGKFKVLFMIIILECLTFILVYTVLFYILISEGNPGVEHLSAFGIVLLHNFLYSID